MATPVTVMEFPTIIPATGIMYLGVNGNTFNTTSITIVTEVPAKIEAPATNFPRGTCFARCPAVYPATVTCGNKYNIISNSSLLRTGTLSLFFLFA